MYQRKAKHNSPHPDAIRRLPHPAHNFGSKEADPHLQSLRTSPRWIELRRLILAARPVCEICARIGSAPHLATEIHHIIPAAVMLERFGDEGFFDLSNLAPLCRKHHQRNEHAWRNGTAASVFPPDHRITEAELWRV